MGACDFHSVSEIADVEKAFRELHEQALYDHGHAGYTGTIAEKGSYVVFSLPSGKTIEEVENAIRHIWGGSGRPDWLPQRMVDVYEDKWGPAVALRADEKWHFIGMASE